MKWKKLFIDHTFGKGLISQIYEELNSVARKQLTMLKIRKRDEQTSFKGKCKNDQWVYEKNTQHHCRQGNANQNYM